MTDKDINLLINRQRDYYKSGATLPISFRHEQLKKLYSAIERYERELNDALNSDLGKSQFEAFLCESGFALTEISYMIKHLKKFAKPKRVHTPLAQFCAKSYVVPIPYGTTLIMSPWNYPLLLTVGPLCNAIAAGNTAILKPSAYSPATSALIKKIIEETFSPEYIAVVEGGRNENAALLDQKFDFIFFTGSQNVGKEVLRRAAEHLTPVVLELGGKSPCIVDSSADIPLSARRIVFGKYLNCGQTCVAPDFILCEGSVKDELVKELKKQIEIQFGNEPLENEDYGRIINEKHFSRLRSLIEKEKIVHGGRADEAHLKIEPTILDSVTYADAVMQEEIFGPILPILTFEDFDATIDELKTQSKPLALYIFSKNKKHIKRVTTELSYGGGCINDVIIHLATSEMGFGGVGESGMGAYHGKRGFDTFSHKKSIVDKKTFIDLPMRYQPYNSKFREKLVRFFLK